MKLCPNCEKENTDHASFCSECGEQFYAPASQAICPACGYGNTDGSAFCSDCGAPLSINAPVFFCPQCGVTVSDTQTTCDVCGSALPQHTAQAATANIPYCMQNAVSVTATLPSPFPIVKVMIGWAIILAFYIMLCIIV